jgi:hypothetical protein
LDGKLMFASCRLIIMSTDHTVMPRRRPTA